MGLWDILILLAVGAMVGLAIRAMRSGRSGSCHGGGSCSGNCAGCAMGGSCGAGDRRCAAPEKRGGSSCPKCEGEREGDLSRRDAP